MLRSSRLPTRAQKCVSRGLGHSSLSLKNTKHSVSFFPTASYLDHESHEQRLKDHEAAVPTRTSFETTPRLFRNMVKPQDVCDLFWKPTYEDYVVTSLAKECSLKGDSLYEIVSRSTINDSNLMFSNLAISWLDDFNAQIPNLKDLTGLDDELLYKSLDLRSSHYFTEDVFRSFESLQEYGNSLLEKKHSLESIIQLLLSHETKPSEYGWIVTFLTDNIYALNPVSVKEFAAYLIGDISQKKLSNSNLPEEYTTSFDTFLCGHLFVEYPDILSGLNASTLDKLAHISTISGNFSTAVISLNVLAQQYKSAPSKLTWATFLEKYTSHALEQNLLKTEILREITNVKPILFHHGFNKEFLVFLLTKIVDNVHDLSHLVQLLHYSSPQILGDNENEIVERLHQILSLSNEPEMLKAVQVAQLKRTLKQAGSKNKAQ